MMAMAGKGTEMHEYIKKEDREDVELPSLRIYLVWHQEAQS